MRNGLYRPPAGRALFDTVVYGRGRRKYTASCTRPFDIRRATAVSPDLLVLLRAIPPPHALQNSGSATHPISTTTRSQGTLRTGLLMSPSVKVPKARYAVISSDKPCW